MPSGKINSNTADDKKINKCPRCSPHQKIKLLAYLCIFIFICKSVYYNTYLHSNVSPVTILDVCIFAYKHVIISLGFRISYLISSIINIMKAPKVILLAARGEIELPGKTKSPFHTSLEWIIHSFKENGVPTGNIVIVGGRQIETLSEKHPEVKFIFNPDWEETGTMHSLS